MRGRISGTDQSRISLASDAARIAPMTSCPRFSICALGNLSTRKPCPVSHSSRATSSARSSCCGPSASTISRCLKQRKSTMYRPITTWRRNFSPASFRSRSSFHNRRSYSTGSCRISFARCFSHASIDCILASQRAAVERPARPLIRPRSARPPSPARGEGRGGASGVMLSPWICFRWREGGCEDVEICDYH